MIDIRTQCHRSGTRIRGAALFCAGAALLASAFSHAQTYSVTDLGVLPGTQSSFAYAVNASGQVAGHTCLGTDGGLIYHAYRWTNGVMQDLGTLGGAQSGAYGINDAGIVAGWARRSSGAQRAVYWGPSGIVDIFRKDNSVAKDVNNANPFQVLAHTPASGKTPARVTLWRNGTSTYLSYPGDNGSYNATALNDFGQVLAESSSGWWLWTPNVPNGTSGSYTLTSTFGLQQVLALNNVGQVGGMIGGPPYTYGVWTPFVPNGTAGTMQMIPGAIGIGGINDAGVVVGAGWNGVDSYAAIWDPVNGLRDLNDLVQPFSGIQLLTASAISNSGYITGYGRVGGSIHGFLLTPQ
jgi:probable HAF family extracellular repeat protein